MKRLLFACALIVGMGSLLEASAVGRLGRYIPSAPKFSLPTPTLPKVSFSLPSLPSLSLNSFKTPEMIQKTINKLTSLFSALKPSSLQNIIKNQTAELSKNMELLQQGYSRITALKIGKNIALAAAAALALGIEAAAVAVPAYIGVERLGGAVREQRRLQKEEASLMKKVFRSE